LAGHYTRPGAATFGGNLVSCRAALATLDFHERNRLGARSTALGARLLYRLRQLQERFPEIAEVRGRGLMVGAELFENGAPAAAHVDDILERMKDRGYLLGKTGTGRNVLTFMPPLVVEAEALDEMTDALGEAFRPFRRRECGCAG
jgi:4-aminobutyrate aminotransferase